VRRAVLLSLGLGWVLSWAFVLVLWYRTGDFDRAVWLAGRSIGYTLEVFAHTSFVLWLFAPVLAGAGALAVAALGRLRERGGRARPPAPPP